MITANLGIGPLSPEIIEAVYQYSEQKQKQMMLIASLNQVNAGGGYVCGWDTYAFKQYCTTMMLRYPRADVFLCRDHCGPFFMGETNLSSSMDTVYANLRADCEVGFDLIHIDMCHLPGNKSEILQAINRAVRFCLNIEPTMLFEVGTDVVGGISDLQELEATIAKLDFPVEFFVVNTGSLVREDKQVGTFDVDNTKLCTDLLHKHGIKAKEHNADYLVPAEIQLRTECAIDAVNIAPQMGVVQTGILLDRVNQCANMVESARAFTNWAHEVYSAGNWKKWTDRTDDVLHCVKVSGHYHFSGENYERLCKVIGLSTEDLITATMGVIDSYEHNN
jgi:hypothetical protein